MAKILLVDDDKQALASCNLFSGERTARDLYGNRR
jgi:hypothetical protein